LKGCETVLVDGDTLLGSCDFAGGGCAGGLELLERGKLALSLGEVEPGSGDVGRERLLLLESSALMGGFEGGFGVAEGALGGSYAGAGVDVVQLHDELAGFDMVALLDVYGADRGGERTVKFLVLDRLNQAVGGHGARQRSADCGCRVYRHAIPRHAASDEKHNYQKD
jgi:hypothetical protein